MDQFEANERADAADEERDELTRLRAEIDKLRSMSALEMMCENLNVKHHIEGWKRRCLLAEKRLAQMKHDCATDS